MAEESHSQDYYKCPFRITYEDRWWCAPIPLRRAKDYSEASEVDVQLFSAADVGDVELLRQSLERGADVNFQHCAGTPLIRAARRGHLACVQALLNHGADVNTSGNFNCETCTALHAAATNGHYEIVQLLLDHGADVNAKRDQESTPLHDAAKFGHLDIVELLLHHGAQINVRNSHGKTPLYFASGARRFVGPRWLLETVIDYYHFSGYPYGAYYYNESFFPKEAVEYLLENKDKVNALNMSNLEDLRAALLKEDLDTIKSIVEDNVKHQVRAWKATPLHYACNRTREGISKILLENGADPNIHEDDVGKTPLHIAADDGSAEIMQALLQRGAQVDVVNNYGETPLHYTKTLDCARVLVNHGADVTAVSMWRRSVLFTAADSDGEGACVQFLIDQGADPLMEDEYGQSALDLAISRLWYFEKGDGGIGSVKALMQNGAKLKKNYTVDKAIKYRKLGLAFALLQSGSDVNAIDEDGLTALYRATTSKFTAAVEMLLEEGADPHIKCHNKSPLHQALLRGYEEIAKLLLQAGAIPDANIYNSVKALDTYRNVFKQLCRMQWQDSDGNSLLHIECYRSAPIPVLGEEVDTNIIDKQGITALHIVCYKGNAHLVKLLLENNADPNKKDINDLTPLHFAAFEGHHEVGVLLLENGADVKGQDVKGQTPAHIAAQCGSTTYLEQLFRHGADVNVRDKLGCTPLHQAEQNRNTECVELLMRHGADRTICIPNYHANCEIPLNLLKNISKFECYIPHISQSEDTEDDSDSDLGFDLFD